MTQIVLIGIGAGAATALLFASRYSGSMLALVLVNLAHMPILIAGIGWSNVAGLVAAAFATLCVGLLFEGSLALVFVVGVALPALWLGHLALLARPANGASPNKLEWYPPGRIVLWAAVAAAVATAVIIFSIFGADAQSFDSNLRALIETAESRLRAGNDLGPEKLFDIELMAKLMPPIVAALSTVVLLLNTSLAARIVNLSGQLRRPWPELSVIRLPRFAPGMLIAALAGIALPGLLGIVSGVFVGAITAAFAVLGLAVVHVITRGVGGRPLALGVVYALAITLIWPAIILALLGLVDAAIDLRGRNTYTRGPPTLH